MPHQIIMWEVFAEVTPYHFLKNPNLIIKYVFYEDGRPNIKEVKGDVDSEILDLIQVNWHKDPATRMEFRDIVPVLQKHFKKL